MVVYIILEWLENKHLVEVPQIFSDWSVNIFMALIFLFSLEVDVQSWPKIKSVIYMVAIEMSPIFIK